LLFNAGCNEQVFSPKQKNWYRSVLPFEKNAKSAPLIPKNDVTVPKARKLGYSNKQLKGY